MKHGVVSGEATLSPECWK